MRSNTTSGGNPVGNIANERRRFVRYDTEMKICFRSHYDIETRVKFKVMASSEKGVVGHKYSGLSRNVSVEGMCFVSNKELKEKDLLLLDVYAPITREPVKMEGQVCWCRKNAGVAGVAGAPDTFQTGVRLISVKGKPVDGSIYFDKTYNVTWSMVLDSLFGSFAALVKEIKKHSRTKK